MNRDCTIAARVALRVERELSEDAVELWTLFQDVHNISPESSDGQVFDIVEVAISVLLAERVQVGHLDDLTGEFVLWGGTVTAKRIMSAVSDLGREPNIGDVAWLVRGVYP